MRKLINRIKSKIRLLIFLLWHDKLSKVITIFLSTTIVSLIYALWQFDLSHISMTGIISPEKQITIRKIGTYLLLSIGLLSLIVLTFFRYKKYKNPDVLTHDELNHFLNYMNESK